MPAADSPVLQGRRASKLHTRMGELEAALAGQAAAAERAERLQRKLAAARVERAAAAEEAAALRRQLLCGPAPSFAAVARGVRGTVMHRWGSRSHLPRILSSSCACQESR